MMKCIIVDDEPLAHKVIRRYCEKLEEIEVLESFKSALDANTYLKLKEVDLMFLDINMPVLKGLDFLRTLRNPPMVIITSAYQEYALEGYELQVIDYLLKPFDFGRFLAAVNKASAYHKLVNDSPKPTNSIQKASDSRIFIKSEKKIHQIQLSDILFLEGAGSYVKIHLLGEVIMTLERLTHFEKELPHPDFIRVHKSFIVATDKIKTIEGNRIFVKDTEIPIGQMYKQNVKKLFE